MIMGIIDLKLIEFLFWFKVFFFYKCSKTGFVISSHIGSEIAQLVKTRWDQYMHAYAPDFTNTVHHLVVHAPPVLEVIDKNMDKW